MNINEIVDSTISNRASRYYNSWKSLAQYLVKSGYNAYETEAILKSDIPLKAIFWRYGHATHNRYTSGCLKGYLTYMDMTPHSEDINRLVLRNNPDLVANDNGVPCHKGRMPGSPGSGEILVPAGTPACCDPTSETYWSM